MLQSCDVLVFSGGSSVGERDLILDVIGRKGEIVFHGIAVKPGKPTVFGTINGKPMFGMPGYPTSCLSNAYMLLVPALREMARLKPRHLATVSLPLGQRIVSTTGRHQFYTVRIVDGQAMPAFKASGDITSMSQADGYIEIPAQTDIAEKGEIVEVKLFYIAQASGGARPKPSAEDNRGAERPEIAHHVGKSPWRGLQVADGAGVLGGEHLQADRLLVRNAHPPPITTDRAFELIASGPIASTQFRTNAMPAPPFRKNPCEPHGRNCATASMCVAAICAVLRVDRHPEHFGADVHARLTRYPILTSTLPRVAVRKILLAGLTVAPQRRERAAGHQPQVRGAGGCARIGAAAGAGPAARPPDGPSRRAVRRSRVSERCRDSLEPPREVGAQLRVAISLLRAIRVLVEACDERSISRRGAEAGRALAAAAGGRLGQRCRKWFARTPSSE